MHHVGPVGRALFWLNHLFYIQQAPVGQLVMDQQVKQENQLAMGLHEN